MKKIFLGISTVIFLLGVSLLYVSLKNTPQAGAATSFGESWTVTEWRVFDITGVPLLPDYVTLGPSKWTITDTSGHYTETLVASGWQDTINGLLPNNYDISHFNVNTKNFSNKARTGFGSNQNWLGNSGNYSFVGCVEGGFGACRETAFGASIPTAWTLIGTLN